MWPEEENPQEYLYDIFVGQDYEDGNFDVTFHVEGKELYAHRVVLAKASDVFKELFKKNRPTRDDPVNRPIQIDGYTYDEFYEFIRMIYCHGDYDYFYPNKDKLFAIIKLAGIHETYGIQEKAGEELFQCGGFQSFVVEEELDDEDIKDIFEKLEFAHKFSLKNFKENDVVKNCLEQEISTLIGYNGFINLEKSTVKSFLYFIDHANQTEELCKAIYKWGEHQAMITVDMPKEKKNQLILHYIKDILPFFSLKLLIEFFVNEIGIISTDEAGILKTIKVIFNCNGKSITGTFVDGYGILESLKVDVYKMLHDADKSGMVSIWKKHFKRPSSPSTVKKMNGVNWYLLFDENGNLCIKHHSRIGENDYLIAEMKASIENESGEFVIKDFGIFVATRHI